MPDVYIPYTGAPVIKVDGACYELQEVVSGPVTDDIIIEEEYETCIDCENDGGTVFVP
jgi:hypothetical protein